MRASCSRGRDARTTVPISNGIAIGLCKIELWELEDSETFFRAAEESAKYYSRFDNKIYQYWYKSLEICCQTGLAFLSSKYENLENRITFLDSIYEEIMATKTSDLWIKVYNSLLLGAAYKSLKNIEKSFEI